MIKDFLKSSSFLTSLHLKANLKQFIVAELFEPGSSSYQTKFKRQTKFIFGVFNSRFIIYATGDLSVIFFYDTYLLTLYFMFSVTKRALKQVGDRNEGGGGRDRGGRGDFGRGGDRGDFGRGGDRRDRGGREERAPRPGDYRGSRDRSRSPRYRQGEDRSHGGASQDRSSSRRDTRTNQGYHDSRDYRDSSRDGSYGGRRQEEGYSHQRSSRGESSRDRSYGSNGSRYQGDSRTSPQERGDRGPGQIKQEENVYLGGARADGNLSRQERPSRQVQVKQEAGLPTEPMSYKEFREMKKMMRKQKE